MEKPSPWELWTLNFELSMSVLAEVEPEVREQGLEMKELFLLGKLDEHPYPADLARVLLTPKPPASVSITAATAVTVALCFRATLPSRYMAPGGPASTGSSCKCHWFFW